MKQMMEGVVENGSAKNLKNAACKIAGKTGTAKVAAGSKGYNSEPKYRASFVGYFPADKPMYSCIVVVDNPSRSVGYYGNVVSGSVFKEIADKIYTMASLMGDNDEDEEEKDGEEPIFISVTAEDGEELTLEFVSVFEVDGQEYRAFFPAEEEEEE